MSWWRVDLPVVWDDNYRIYLLLNTYPGHELTHMVVLYETSDTIVHLQHLMNPLPNSGYYFELDFGMAQYLAWNPDFSHPNGFETPTPFASPLVLEDPPGAYSYGDLPPVEDEQDWPGP